MDAVLSNALIDQRLASRLLLFCLLFEEMQLACVKIVNGKNLIDKLVDMLQMVTCNKQIIDTTSAAGGANQATTATAASPVNTTPIWLTSLLILVDLIEKAALATRRKAAINEQFRHCTRIWKWYEERQNRWVVYSFANNKIIDQAYRNGETNVKIVASRKHYIIHFNTMLQENEETLHKRPIMLTFEKAATAEALSSTATTTTASDPPASETATAAAASSAAASAAAASRPSTPLPTEVVHGLQTAQTSAVIESCVELISWPVADPDCLHAILRLILRLTRHYSYAIEFAARRGPQHLLQLTQRNSFTGYASLITLIFRHICEDERNLRLTMEKAIRLALTGSQVNIAGLTPGGIGSRELHNVLRLLGPAICRHPDLFCEVACDILRVVLRREDEQFLNTSSMKILEQQVHQTLSSAPGATGYCLRTLPAKQMAATPMPDYARELVVDLLNYLIKPVSMGQKQVTAEANVSTGDAAKASSSSL